MAGDDTARSVRAGAARAAPVLLLLALAHVLLGPRSLDVGANATLFVANVAAVLYGLHYRRAYGPVRFGAYLAGYLAFFLLIAWRPSGTPLVALFILLYASLFRLPRLLFHFLLFVLCVELVPEYLVELWPVLALLLELVHHALVTANERFIGWSFLVGFVLLGLILVPVLGLSLGQTPQTLSVTFDDPEVRDALAVSLLTATLTTAAALCFGVPLAYAMARTRFWGRRVLESLVDLPILVPQSVAGVAILLAIGPKTTAGLFLQDHLGLRISGTVVGIVLAQLFVSAPFLVRSAVTAFSEVDPRLEYVSRSLGASPAHTFLHVTLPLALPGIFAGAVLTWARAISESGAVMLVAYHPFTISTLVNDRFTQFGTDEAAPVASLLVLICLFIFLALNLARWLPLGGFALRARGEQDEVRRPAARGDGGRSD